jgi:rhamnosyltransferase
LNGIFAQQVDGEVECLAIDSGSTDGSLEILRSYPIRIIQIHPDDFSHGDTRNLGAAETDGDYISFIVQDALPGDRFWLARLVKNLSAHKKTAGAYSRVVPQPGCGPLVERGVQGDLNFRADRIEMNYKKYGPPEEWDPHVRRIRANFNDVASMVRRKVWERIPFQRTPFGEDIMWADSVLRAGYQIVYDPKAYVIHSHEYQVASIYPRTFIDGWLNRAYFQRLCIEKASHVVIMAFRSFREDKDFLRTKGLAFLKRFGVGMTSLAYHLVEFLGFYMGGRTEERIRPLAPLSPRPLRVLWGDSGEEEAFGALKTHSETAAQIEEAGIELTHVREDTSPRQRPFTKEVWEGRTLYRVRGIYSEPEVRMPTHWIALQGSLIAALNEARADVVHCLDFTPFTAALSFLCHNRGIPCIITLRNFWFRCPKKNLVRPDGTYCSMKRPPGLGCAACMAGQTELIFPLVLIDRLLGVMGASTRREERDNVLSQLNALYAEGRRLGMLTYYHLRPRIMRESLNQAEFIVAPHRLFHTKCLEAGLKGRNLVHIEEDMRALDIEGLHIVLNGEGGAWAEPGRGKEPKKGSPARSALELAVKYRQAAARKAFMKRRSGLWGDRSVEGRDAASCQA